MTEFNALKTGDTPSLHGTEATSLDETGGVVLPSATGSEPSSSGSTSTNFFESSSYSSSNENMRAERKGKEPVRPANDDHPHSNLFQSSYSPSTKKPKKKIKDPDRAPRPPNAWILYRAQKNSELVEQQKEIESRGFGGARLRQSEVSRMISSMWQSESQETRERFAELAKRHKAEHKIMYPNYEYRPRLVTAASEGELVTLNSIKGESSKLSSRTDSSGQRISARRRGSSRHGAHSSREFDSSDATGSVSPISLQGSFQTLPGMGIGVDESSFDGLPAGSPDFGPQRRISRPRALTDLIRSPQQFSSPPFNAQGNSELMRSPSNFQLSSSPVGREFSKGRDLVRKDREEEGDAAPIRSAQARRMVKPSAFLPLSYQAPALESLSLQSPTGEFGSRNSIPNSAFPIWNQTSTSPSSNFSQHLGAPHSAPATSTDPEHSSFSLAMDSMDRGLPRSMTSYETMTDSQQYGNFFSTDSKNSNFPNITPSSSVHQSFPHSRDSLYSSGRHGDSEWDNAVGKAHRELNPWNETPWSQASRYNGEVIGSQQETGYWKGKGKQIENQIDVGINAGQRQGQSSQDGAFVSPRSFWNFSRPSDPRIHSNDDYWNRPLANSRSEASSLGSLDVNPASQVHQGEGHVSSSTGRLSMDQERQAGTPSAGLRLELGQLGGQEEIELHGSYTPSELLNKILELNKGKTPEQH